MSMSHISTQKLSYAILFGALAFTLSGRPGPEDRSTDLASDLCNVRDQLNKADEAVCMIDNTEVKVSIRRDEKELKERTPEKDITYKRKGFAIEASAGDCSDCSSREFVLAEDADKVLEKAVQQFNRQFRTAKERLTRERKEAAERESKEKIERERRENCEIGGPKGEELDRAGRMKCLVDGLRGKSSVEQARHYEKNIQPELKVLIESNSADQKIAQDTLAQLQNSTNAHIKASVTDAGTYLAFVRSMRQSANSPQMMMSSMQQFDGHVNSRVRELGMTRSAWSNFDSPRELSSDLTSYRATWDQQYQAILEQHQRSMQNAFGQNNAGRGQRQQFGAPITSLPGQNQPRFQQQPMMGNQFQRPMIPQQPMMNGLRPSNGMMGRPQVPTFGAPVNRY